MTLGRTSSGAIKIKTAGGFRAVECACCGGGCGCESVSGTLKAIIESASQITVNGITQIWDGILSQGQLDFGEVSWNVNYKSGILCVLGDDGDNTVTLGDGCLFTTGPDIHINGEAFTASHAFADSQIAMEVTFS